MQRIKEGIAKTVEKIMKEKKNNNNGRKKKKKR